MYIFMRGRDYSVCIWAYFSQKYASVYTCKVIHMYSKNYASTLEYIYKSVYS